MNVEEKYIPLGSIVSLKNSNKKIMIIGINQKAEENDLIYDYCACLHPYGYLSSNELFLFNHEKIDKVWHMGYYDDLSKDYFEDVLWSSKQEKEN